MVRIHAGSYKAVGNSAPLFRFYPTFIHSFIQSFLCGGVWGQGRVGLEVRACLCAIACLVRERPLVMIHFHLPPYQSQELNSGSQVRQIAPLPTAPSHQTMFHHYLFKLLKPVLCSHIKACCTYIACKIKFQPSLSSFIFHPTTCYALPINPMPHSQHITFTLA